MAKYETMLITSAALDEEASSALIGKFKSLIEANGTIDSIDGIDGTVSLDQGLELTDESGRSLLVESSAGNQHGFVLCHFVAPPFGLKGLKNMRPRVHSQRGVARTVRRVCSDSNLL